MVNALIPSHKPLWQLLSPSPLVGFLLEELVEVHSSSLFHFRREGGKLVEQLGDSLPVTGPVSDWFCAWDWDFLGAYSSSVHPLRISVLGGPLSCMTSLAASWQSELWADAAIQSETSCLYSFHLSAWPAQLGTWIRCESSDRVASLAPVSGTSPHGATSLPCAKASSVLCTMEMRNHAVVR